MSGTVTWARYWLLLSRSLTSQKEKSTPRAENVPSVRTRASWEEARAQSQGTHVRKEAIDREPGRIQSRKDANLEESMSILGGFKNNASWVQLVSHQRAKDSRFIKDALCTSE